MNKKDFDRWDDPMFIAIVLICAIAFLLGLLDIAG